MKMNEDIKERVKERIKELVKETQASMAEYAEIQTSMVQSAKSSYFSEPELTDLHHLIGVTCAFFQYLENPGAKQFSYRPSTVPASVDFYLKHTELFSDFGLSYAIETVFSAVYSYSGVNQTYRGLVGSTKSEIDWNKVSISTFNEQFTSKFHEFVAEPVFEKQCRLLLDLFKLQLVFAGFFYD